MTSPRPQVSDVPSARQLAVTTATALLVAAVILVTIVLPAEYGIDPLRTGAALGLNALSAQPVKAEAPPNGSTMFKPVLEGPVAHYAAGFKTDTAEFQLDPYEYLEYKYRLDKDASMMFRWNASGDVKHDFHGDPDEKGAKEQSYDKRARREGYGSFTAPFSGIHGWFWENTGSHRITIRIQSTGFYASAVEIRSDHTRHEHQLTETQPTGKNP